MFIRYREKKKVRVLNGAMARSLELENKHYRREELTDKRQH